MPETSATSSTPITYSSKALKALRDTLVLHQGIVWIDPATNQLAVKRINPAVAAVDQGDQTQPLQA
ncbi:MAG: hypothetical protein WDZ94_04720 [Patescibacteria group bacterium]